ncbi:gliding motility-associated C-terminal domain-containing protein [Flavobacterium cellulosilyticum]|uniref:Gliding motility-associated C-terminal domain-containing protein n=1 Tax=Flavobacterium cellulosilyticum TaxID=2541731 RepID=A0A4R5C8M4_9FLAO|nr:gliding motility-associated C-terminal domain-containing protein [Flavobacterium cellulosilyticum]TDD96201.1 gliding motility-associated C-terminal domain-containing protein [Flavobacterium cellulosilyticum]
MKRIFQKIVLGFSLLIFNSFFGQDISLLKQFNGRYDFILFGNTLNPDENTFQIFPTIFTSSSAVLNLNPDDVIEKAYLYWAGSGTGDFDIKLNGQTINPERTFSFQRQLSNVNYDYFSAFKDITTQIQSIGSATYILSYLDVTPFLYSHFNIRTNFAGWAIIIIYKNENLSLNQLNVYDGLQAVPNEVNITLNSLNVIDNKEAEIAFLAWEGDVGIAVNETVRINGNPISNPPLNPIDNAFNGTNSFTNSNTLYNMDLDVYPIQNNIKIGDTAAQIQLTSGQDFVMINAIVTKLNSQLPDATISANNISSSCDSRAIAVDYTVSNMNSTSILPTNTPISIYINSVFYKTIFTQTSIPINGSEKSQTTIDVPTSISDPFELKFVVDDDVTGAGIVAEINENNNDFKLNVALLKSPLFNSLQDKEVCNEGLSKGTFDFSDYEAVVKVNATDTVRFYETIENAQNEINPIFNTSNFIVQTTPKTIYTRIDNTHCSSVTTFKLTTTNCPPVVHNYISANNDFRNDTFHVDGLKNVFPNYKISIYNRWGTLVWTGNNTSEEWDGYANKGLRFDTKKLPTGTYFYTIDLNDPDYNEALSGYLFLKQ